MGLLAISHWPLAFFSEEIGVNFELTSNDSNNPNAPNLHASTGGRSREQTEQIESGGRQRSCKRWADRQKENSFTFRLSAQGL